MTNKYNKPLLVNGFTFNGLSQEHKQTLKRMMDIQNALFGDNYELNFLNPKTNYIVDYFKIIMVIENKKKDYSDAYISRLVNDLYNKMFKNRRY